MDYAIEMTRTPQEVPDELVAALRAQLDDAQLVELTYAIGWENFRARTNHAFGIESAGFSEGAACALAQGDGGARDAGTLARTGGDPELEALAEHAAGSPSDLG